MFFIPPFHFLNFLCDFFCEFLADHCCELVKARAAHARNRAEPLDERALLGWSNSRNAIQSRTTYARRARSERWNVMAKR